MKNELLAEQEVTEIFQSTRELQEVAGVPLELTPIREGLAAKSEKIYTQ